MYLNPTDKYWAFDIEGNDLLPGLTKIWCLCAVNIKTGEEVTLSDERKIYEWVETHRKEGCVFIAHNGLGYDAPACNRILGCSLSVKSIVDILVLSMVYSPSLNGGHSLEEWGVRLRYPKGQYNDFSRLTLEMLEYCMNDARLCKRIYLELVRRMRKLEFTDVGLEIEHQAWALIRKQRENGFKFNIKEAHILYGKIRALEEDLKEQIYHYWPPELQIVARYKQAKKKDGSYTKQYLAHKDQFVKVEELNDGGYVAWDYVSFNLGSPDQRRDKLLSLGWEPREFTKPSKSFPNGQAKATDKGELVPSLVEFVEESGKDEVLLIARWIDLNARGNSINTWIEAYNDDTGCIHGSLWLANTLRYRHSNPNTANIPAVRLDKDDQSLRGIEGVFTYEARDLWTCRGPDRRLVGVDAKGIQLRVLAHYLNNPKFTEAILSEDPHAANRDAWGFSKDKAGRALAKTIVYATLMGAGDARVQFEAKLDSLKDAKEAKAIFFDQVPELPRLINNLKSEYKRTGRISLCSGLKIIPPKDYMVIPYLLQGDESQIMRKAAILSAQEIARRNLDVLKVGDIHDEWQNDAHVGSVEELIQSVYPESFSSSGKFFNYNLPIDCDSKVGLTWAETH